MTNQLSSPTLKLYGSYTSPFVRHCRIILMDNDMADGVDYEFVDTDYQSSAEQSPTSRVPFFQDKEEGTDVSLYDSSSILHYLRDKQNQKFLTTPLQTEVYALANTVLDTLINLFLLEKSGVSDANNSYLQRHHQRALDTLAMLNEIFADHYTEINPLDDASIRVACMLDWCAFRKRAEISNYPNLMAFLGVMNTWNTFAITHPSNIP